MAKKADITKTIILWVILIGLFAFFYNHFEKPPERLEPDERASWTEPVLFVGLVVLCAIGVGLVALLWWRRRLKRWSRWNDTAVGLYNDARYVEALAVSKGLVTHAPSETSRAFGLINVGTMQLHLGRFDEALAALEEANKLQMLKLQPEWNALCALVASVAAGLAGQLSTAQRWLDAAKTHPHNHFVMQVFAEGILLARDGRAAAAADLLEANWDDIDSRGGAPLRKAARMIVAWSRQESGTGGAREIATWVSGIHPLRDGEIEFLGASWPEIRAFMDQHARRAA